ncbi:hypothetical protein DNTS_034533 [Danionella cerebrum]|uniref:Uncharacterized protein n=1 Tax=Danionella cerebrum TaxID=2873325 RepID=A0A553MPL5_9TELE|nr:hypothetical protein DNTS_034533 [Danionella translucida]
MDQTLSDLPHIIIDAEGKIPKTKKKKKKKKINKPESLEQLDMTRSSEVLTENQSKKKRKRSVNEPDSTADTGKKKKKRRKADKGGETSVLDEAVSDVLEMQHKDLLIEQPQELEALSEPKPHKKKKKKKEKRTHCENMPSEEQSATVSDSAHQENSSVGTRKFKSKRGSAVDPKLFKELCDFYPENTFAQQRPSDIKKQLKYDLPRFRRFREQGITLRCGRFSAAENLRLGQNVQDFMALTGVKDPIMLFHPKRFPREAKMLRNLKKQHCFFEHIADGIPRSCNHVFKRGTKVYDDRNNKGNFTEEEDRMLLKYHKMYGSNWAEISERTDRSRYSLEKRFSHRTINTGPWSNEEVQRLLRAVKHHVVSALTSKSPNKLPKRVSREALYQKLPWYKISASVKTRNWTKCREKWMTKLAFRMSSGFTYRGRAALQAKIKLIKAMYEMEVEDAVDIHWEDLTAVLGDVPPAYVQVKWHQLKVCHVPNWKQKCFGDIVDYLYEKVLPQLVKDNEEYDDSELYVDQKESFLLSDIFQDIEDECSSSQEEMGQEENVQV